MADAWREGFLPLCDAVDSQDRLWYVETDSNPNRIIGFDTQAEKVISINAIPSGGGSVRNMVYHEPTGTIWFGTDTHTIGGARVPEEPGS